jgi:SAM-dependent methyltransferase
VHHSFVPTRSYYGADLARIHHEGFGFHAHAVAAGVLALLEPVRQRGGLVLEIGCGSGLLTSHLVRAGYRVWATDASTAMVELARDHVPGAEAVEPLCLPDDPVPSADAIVSVGHALSYLDDEHQVHQAVAALAQALRPNGVIAFDICDVRYGAARREEPPKVWFAEDWVLITRTSVPEPRRFRRDMTMFVRSGRSSWRRTDELHDNVLINTTELLPVLKTQGVAAELRASFGNEVLPTGLQAVVGMKTGNPRAHRAVPDIDLGARPELGELELVAEDPPERNPVGQPDD